MDNRAEMYLAYKKELSALGGQDISWNEAMAEGDLKDIEYAQEEGLANWLDIRDGKGFVIIAKGKGYMTKMDCQYYIGDVYLKPEYRRQGIMTKVFKELFAENPGKYGLYIMDNNKVAHSFWSKLVGDRWIYDPKGASSDKCGQEYAFEIEGNKE